MKLLLDDVQYHPSRGTAAVLCIHALGRFNVNATEDEFEAQSGVEDSWSNADVLAVIQAKVAKGGQFWNEHPHLEFVEFECVMEPRPKKPAKDGDTNGEPQEIGATDVAAISP